MPENLKLMIRAGYPLISIQTMDEPRAVALVQKVARELTRPIFEWSITDGLRPLSEYQLAGREPDVPAGHAAPALEHIKQSSGQAIYLLKDMGQYCKDAKVYRLMRDLVSICGERKTTLVMLDALPLPEEIKRFTVRFELGWPTVEELEVVVRETFKRVRREHGGGVEAKVTRNDLDHLVQSLRGLSCGEAERVIATAIHDDKTLCAEDLPRVVEAKRTLLGSLGSLESISVDFSPEDIGGLANLKAWLRQRRDGFSLRAREFGLEPPRGVLMLGVQGCGKSLCAKAVAADWKMPLLRLDPGVLYQKFIGETESRLREALAQAEAMSPVVLWIDEIEKAFASAAAVSSDGGLSQRMFGSLLSWMQDHRHPIFLVATANDISRLPPELMRKGRFDEVFFIDLPGREAREQILAIHLRRRKRDPERFAVSRIADAAEGFSGAELEQAVISGLFAAFSAGTDLSDEHLLSEIGKTRPLSVLMGERIADLRAWAHRRCVPAD